VAGDLQQAHTHGIGQAGAVQCVETQLHRARHLVDVLPAAPEDRMKLSLSSQSAMTIEDVTRSSAIAAV